MAAAHGVSHSRTHESVAGHHEYPADNKHPCSSCDAPNTSTSMKHDLVTANLLLTEF